MSANFNKEDMAIDIYSFCSQRHLWDDIIIYFDGKAWSSFEEWDSEKGEKIGNRLYEYSNKNPHDYFEYADPDTLSMSFEGDFYDVMNYSSFEDVWADWREEFDELLAKYNCYYELGNAWNLTVVED